MVSRGQGCSGSGWRGVVRERRGVWVERRAVEGECEELDLVCVKGLGAGLGAEGLEAGEEGGCDGGGRGGIGGGKGAFASEEVGVAEGWSWYHCDGMLVYALEGVN